MTPLRPGVLDGLLAGVSFGVMAFFVRHVRHEVPSAELVFLRAIAGVIVFAPLVRGRLRGAFGRGSLLLWIRAVVGTAAMLAFYWNLQNTNVGTAKAFTMLAPILLALLTGPLLGEPLRRHEIFAIAVAMAGVAALYLPQSAGPGALVTLVGVGGACCTCVALLALRRAAARYPSAVVVWCFSLVSAAIAPLISGPTWTVPTGSALWLSLGVAATGVAGQVFMTRAFRVLRAPIVSALGLTSLAWGVGCEVMFEGFRPSALELAAYGLMLLGVARLRGTTEPVPVRPRRGPDYSTTVQ